jgi:hypothetical protein
MAEPDRGGEDIEEKTGNKAHKPDAKERFNHRDRGVEKRSDRRQDRVKKWDHVEKWHEDKAGHSRKKNELRISDVSVSQDVLKNATTSESARGTDSASLRAGVAVEWNFVSALASSWRELFSWLMSVTACGIFWESSTTAGFTAST